MKMNRLALHLIIFPAVLWAATVPSAHADVKVATAFTDHMVLQRDLKVPIWGTADAGEQVTVTAGEAKGSAKADEKGRWCVTLDPLKASEQPMDVIIAGTNSLTLHDVLVGDVWVASGQSNMEFAFSGANNAAQQRASADRKNIRLLLVNKAIAFEPQTDLKGQWQVCSPSTVNGFSAVAYFFGIAIEADQHVPIGLVGTYWGGQPAQSFTSIEGLKAEPSLKPLVDSFEKAKKELPESVPKYKNEVLPAFEKSDADWKTQHADELKDWDKAQADARAAHQPAPTRPAFLATEPHRPTSPDQTPSVPSVLFNGMINPLIPMAIKGVIWYQGESNWADPVQYQTLFPAMITDWRKQWSEGDFPFIWVQLANYTARLETPTQTSNYFPGVREAQSMTLKLPNTGQAVIIDIGDGSNIHPKDKLDVGRRLALAARHVAYGEDIVYSGPTFDSLKIDGSKAIVTFKNIGSGLTIAAPPSTQMSAAGDLVPTAEPASSLKGFSIAGDDHKFHWADATIDGDHIVVSSEKVPSPVAVRYAWAANPEANLYNKEHLPASPFRTDSW